MTRGTGQLGQRARGFSWGGRFGKRARMRPWTRCSRASGGGRPYRYKRGGVGAGCHFVACTFVPALRVTQFADAVLRDRRQRHLSRPRHRRCGAGHPDLCLSSPPRPSMATEVQRGVAGATAGQHNSMSAAAQATSTTFLRNRRDRCEFGLAHRTADRVTDRRKASGRCCPATAATRAPSRDSRSTFTAPPRDPLRANRAWGGATPARQPS